MEVFSQSDQCLWTFFERHYKDTFIWNEYNFNERETTVKLQAQNNNV